MTASYTAAAAFAAHVSRFRGRLAVVHLTRAAINALAVALLVAEAFAILHPGTPFRAVALALLTFGIGGAAVDAARRFPSMRRTARMLDSRLGLQDLVTTAMQFQDRRDPMSRLLVNAAETRLAGVSASSVFPVELPRGAVAVILGAVVALSVGTRAHGSRSMTWLESGSESHMTAAAAAIGANSRATLASSRTSTATDAGHATDRTASDPASVLTREPRSAPIGGAPSTRAGITHPESTGGTLESHTTMSAGAEDTTGTRRPDGTAGGGSSGVTEPLAGAGGVNGVDGVHDTPSAIRAPIDRPELSRTAASYRAAWSRAQSAVSQERIPAPLRDYVRRYFSAIRRQP